MNNSFYIVVKESGAQNPSIPTWANDIENEIKLDEDLKHKITRVDLENVPGAFQLLDVLTTQECDNLIKATENLGYLEDAAVSLPRSVRHNNNITWVVDDLTHDIIWDRCKDFMYDNLDTYLEKKPLSLNKRYLTIHRLFTPKAFRKQGFANKLLAELFNIKSDTNIDRFKILCVSSSLEFYNSIGLSYWGVNSLNQYYCDFEMPKYEMSEIAQIVKDSSTSEFTQVEYESIYKKLKDNGSEFNTKQTGIHQSSMDMLGDKYMHNSFLEQHLKNRQL
ncbi:MAG: hypothetical protein ACJAWW_001701 [Sulfurimonas sp.]|jgi:hypothetical protein